MGIYKALKKGLFTSIDLLLCAVLVQNLSLRTQFQDLTIFHRHGFVLAIPFVHAVDDCVVNDKIGFFGLIGAGHDGGEK